MGVDALRCWKGWPGEPPSQEKFVSGLGLDEVSMTDVEVATSYLASHLPRTAKQHLQVKSGVVRLANEGHVFCVARSNSLKVFLQKVLHDTRA